MRLRKESLLRMLFVLAIITLVCAVPLLAATEEVEITGTVLASEWDANDNVTGVVIATDEGEEIVVSKSGKGMELLKLDEKTVKATGMIAMDEDDNKTITVTRYIILQ